MSIRQRLDDSSNWIMHDPKSMVILMLMGSGLGTLFFATFSISMAMFTTNWFFIILFGIFSLLSLKQFIGIIKSIRKLGFKDALGGFTAGAFVWSRDKNWNKIEEGGIENGNSRYEDNEGSNKYYEEGDGKIGKEVRDIYR